MDRVAAILLNYNMGEVIEQNVDYIKRCVKSPVDIFVVDQSSNPDWSWPLDEDAADKATLYASLSSNLHATHGFNTCLRLADSYAEYNDLGEYFAYWVITTTGLLDPDGTRTDDCLAPLLSHLENDGNAVVVQPAYREDSKGFWQHLYTRGGTSPRRVFMIEHSAALFRGDWFRDIGFMEPQIHVHGTDLWYSYLARMEERGLYVHEGTWIKRHNDNMHEMGRSFEGNPQGRTTLARKSFERFGHAMLGPLWEQRLVNEYTDPAWT